MLIPAAAWLLRIWSQDLQEVLALGVSELHIAVLYLVGWGPPEDLVHQSE